MHFMSSEQDTSADALQKYTLDAPFQSGLLNIDYAGTIIYANSFILQILGLPAKKVIGKNLFALLARLFKKRGFLKHWEFPKHLYQTDAYLTIQNDQGDEVRLKISAHEMADMGLALIVDQCHEPPYQYQTDSAVIEHLPVPVISILADGKINRLNHAFEKFCQLSASTLVGAPVAVLEGLFPELPSLFLQTLHDAHPQTQLIPFSRLSPQAVLRVDTNPITAWGKVIEVIVCLHVSDNPKSVSELMPNHEVHDIISRLVEETAHRVRNPLTVVKGFIQLYRDNPENIPWDLLLEEVSRIEKTLQDLMILSSNYRDMREQVNLNHIIAELYPNIEANARQKGVWLELYLERSRKVNICGDADRIKALVNHLITMFLHFMGEGELLTIQTKSCKDGVMLMMADSGDAKEDQLESVFNPSAQFGARGTDFRRAVCKHLVDSLGGRVHITHKKNSGNVITVTIPHTTG